MIGKIVVIAKLITCYCLWLSILCIICGEKGRNLNLTAQILPPAQLGVGGRDTYREEGKVVQKFHMNVRVRPI